MKRERTWPRIKKVVRAKSRAQAPVRTSRATARAAAANPVRKDPAAARRDRIRAATRPVATIPAVKATRMTTAAVRAASPDRDRQDRPTLPVPARVRRAPATSRRVRAARAAVPLSSTQRPDAKATRMTTSADFERQCWVAPGSRRCHNSRQTGTKRKSLQRLTVDRLFHFKG
ncbi:MAG: hypothetical protein JWR56_3071 [Massilia sp.]|nr:hypothetical protein [Massilia sp.]